MSAADADKERRRRPRITLHGEVQGRIHTVAAAPVLDISEAGALLEVNCSLRPGSVYVLRLPLGHDDAAIKCKVVRSSVHGIAPKGQGESQVLYWTAVEFLEVSPAQRDALQRRLGDLGGSYDTEFGG